MALKVYTISVFRKDIKRLTKSPKYGYSTALRDIKTFLNSCENFDEVWQQESVLKFSNIHRVIKKRIENSGMKRGKRSSFRLIYIVNKQYEEVCLLHVYPKIGKYGKNNITLKEQESLQKQFLQEVRGKKLEEFEI